MNHSTNQFHFSTPEELIRLSGFFPYWEIRDEGNRFLISKKPLEGELVLGNEFHNNDEGKDFSSALQIVINKGQGLFKFLRIKFGQKRNDTKNYSYFILNMSGQPQEEIAPMVSDFMPSYNRATTLNGAPQQNGDFSQQMQLMEARYEKMFNDKVMELERRVFQREKNDFLKQVQEFEAKKDEALNGVEVKENWEKIIDASPKIVESIAGAAAAIMKIAKGQELPLAGTTKEEEKTTLPKKERKRMSFEVEGKEKPTETNTTNADTLQNNTSVNTDLSFLAGLNEEQIHALQTMADSLKAGKLYPDEVKEIAENPQEFFENETDKEETIIN